ncbi:unnamed protein product [Lampetra fluviatilis]
MTFIATACRRQGESADHSALASPNFPRPWLRWSPSATEKSLRWRRERQSCAESSPPSLIPASGKVPLRSPRTLPPFCLSSGKESPPNLKARQAEALRALPAALDDDALAMFCTIPSAERATLPQALAQIAAIYDPPSNVRHKFAARRRGEAGMPFAFRSALLALAKAAFPKMDHAGVDLLVLERLLMLARDLNIVLPAIEKDDLSSLKVVTCQFSTWQPFD